MVLIFNPAPERDAFEIAGGSPACLMLHGFIGDTREMRPLAETISQTFGFHVYSPLWPGHGSLPHFMQGLEVPQFMQAAHDALTKIREQHSEVVVFGFSMGGALAAQLISEHPVAGFIALAPMLSVRTPLLPLSPLARYFLPWIYPLKMGNIDFLRLRQVILDADPTLDLDDPVTLARLREEVRFPLPITNELRKMANQARKAARNIYTPTLIFQGGADMLLRPAGAEHFYDDLASADKQYRFIPGVGHDLVARRNPAHDEVVRTITEWLSARFSR